MKTEIFYKIYCISKHQKRQLLKLKNKFLNKVKKYLARTFVSKVFFMFKVFIFWAIQNFI